MCVRERQNPASSHALIVGVTWSSAALTLLSKHRENQFNFEGKADFIFWFLNVGIYDHFICSEIFEKR